LAVPTPIPVQIDYELDQKNNIERIIRYPKQAVRCFYISGAEILVVGASDEVRGIANEHVILDGKYLSLDAQDKEPQRYDNGHEALTSRAFVQFVNCLLVVPESAPSPTTASLSIRLALVALRAHAGGGGGGAEVPPELARLRTNPQFPQLARMVAQNPQMLAQILPALGQTDPQAMQAVMANPQAFMRMIQEEAAGGGTGGGGGGEMAAAAAELAQNPEMLQTMVENLLPQIEQSDPQAAEAIRQNPQLLIQMLQQHGGMPGAGGGGAPPNVIRLSDEENAAVERLAALGFDKQTAAEAYLACDKNEELAANFLFDGAGA